MINASQGIAPPVLAQAFDTNILVLYPGADKFPEVPLRLGLVFRIRDAGQPYDFALVVYRHHQ
jgi:hypothetical protein